MSQTIFTVPADLVGGKDVPPSSPYYGRIRSLQMERDFASPNSPEHRWIDRQIRELAQREHERTAANISLTAR